MRRTFELGGVIVAEKAAGDIEVAFEPFGGSTWPPLRMLNGDAVVQQVWQKLRVRVSGGGIVPAGLSGLDYTAQLTLKSSASRAIQSASNVITIPAARRVDTGYAPAGFAVVGGRYVPTAIALIGNVATLTAVTGASNYGVIYWPQLIVYARFTSNMASASARHTWQIDAEEV